MPEAEVIFYKEGRNVLVLDWLRTVPAKAQLKCFSYLARLEADGHALRRPVADYLRDGIYELRPSLGGVQYRILYFFPRDKASSPGTRQAVVVSHGIVKEAAVPAIEIDRAVRRREKFETDPKSHSFRPARVRI